MEGVRCLVEINYQDPDWPNGFEHHHLSLKRTVLSDGVAFGAFDCIGIGDSLVGIASLNRIGEEGKAQGALLDQLFITREYRNRGIGKTLFQLCASAAKDWGSDRILIFAGSAEETIAFYFARGCREAEIIHREAEGFDPRDFQLEFEIPQNDPLVPHKS